MNGRRKLILDYPLAVSFFVLFLYSSLCLFWMMTKERALQRELSYVTMQRTLYQDRANRLEAVVTKLRNEEGR